MADPAVMRRGIAAAHNTWVRGFLCACVLGATGNLEAADKDAAELKQLRVRIEALQEKLNQTRGQRDSVRDEVRGIERRIGQLINDLHATEKNLRTHEKKLADLNTRAGRERNQLAGLRQGLQRQLYTAYLMGREDYTKMLFNLENPSQVARVLTYYRYLNEARTTRISQIQSGLTRLEGLERQIRDRRQELETLRTRQTEQKNVLETARARRGELLASLNREVRSQSHEIERLRSDEKRLEQLVEELKTVQAGPPPGRHLSFSKLRGYLPLPVQGRLLARYGGSKNVGNLKWRGLLISGREGQDAKAVFRGRVVFADWLRGFGLLLILDHGDGYMTLYGHNQSLRKNVGDWVEAGETIASLGNTGDRTEPGLYFEIRHNGEPRDPLVWCKTR